MKIIIRPLNKRDIKEVSKLLLPMWFEHAKKEPLVDRMKLEKINLERYLIKDAKREKGLFLVAVAQYKIIGVIKLEVRKARNFHKKEEQLYLDNFAVNPKLRRQGVGTKLIKACLEFAHKKKIKLVTCEVYSFNKTSKKLFQKLKFRDTFSFYSKKL